MLSGSVRSIYGLPRLYDRLTPGQEDEQRFLCDFADGAATILEVASGCGALARRLGRHAEITALDASAEMVAYATAKLSPREHVQFIQADMRWFRLDRRFDLAYAVDNALAHACTDQDLWDTLTAIRYHLRPEGRLIIQLGRRSGESADDLVHPWRKVGRAGGRWDVYAMSTYDPATRINERIFEIRAGAACLGHATLRMRMHDVSLLRAALSRCGFRIDRIVPNPDVARHVPVTEDSVHVYECQAVAAPLGHGDKFPGH